MAKLRLTKTELILLLIAFGSVALSTTEMNDTDASADAIREKCSIAIWNADQVTMDKLKCPMGSSRYNYTGD